MTRFEFHFRLACDATAAADQWLRRHQRVAGDSPLALCEARRWARAARTNLRLARTAWKTQK